MNTRDLKRQHNIKTWTPIIHECKNSGMTVKDWCQRNDINEKKFYYWQNRIRERVLAPAVTDVETSTTFVKIPSATQIHTTSFQPDMILNYGNLRMELSNTASPELLSNVMKVLHHA